MSRNERDHGRSGWLSTLVIGALVGLMGVFGYALWMSNQQNKKDNDERAADIMRLEGTEAQKWNCTSPLGWERVHFFCNERLMLLEWRPVSVQPVICGEADITIEMTEGVGNSLIIEKSGLMRRKADGRSVVGSCRKVVPKP